MKTECGQICAFFVTAGVGLISFHAGEGEGVLGSLFLVVKQLASENTHPWNYNLFCGQ